MLNTQTSQPNIEPDVFSVGCGSRRVLDLIADTWSVLVLYALRSQTLRYSELERKIEGISQKMLTQTLRQLERDGLITRVTASAGSSFTGYTVSPLGESLLVPLAGICDWAQIHLHEVEQARRDYERA